MKRESICVFTSRAVGIAAHDVTGQATSEVVNFQVPGIAETMRATALPAILCACSLATSPEFAAPR